MLVILYSIVIIAIQIQHSSQFMKAQQPRQVGLVVYLMQNLRLRGRPPPIIVASIVRPMNALQCFQHIEKLFTPSDRAVFLVS